MDAQTLMRNAYHECGRVVFAYTLGYSCDSLTVSGVEGGAGKAVIDFGADAPIIQKIVTGNHASISPAEQAGAAEAAKRLMAVNCAGACAVVIHEHGGTTNAQTEIEIPGHELRYVELAQRCLKTAVENHPENFPAQVIKEVFKKLQEREIWKAVDALSKEALNQRALNRFRIVDTLMAAGMKVPKPTASAGFNVGLRGDDQTNPQVQEQKTSKGVRYNFQEENPLDLMLNNFLQKIKSDWKAGEAEAAADYLKKLFRKYDQMGV